jgi:hypothetical protein
MKTLFAVITLSLLAGCSSNLPPSPAGHATGSSHGTFFPDYSREHTTSDPQGTSNDRSFQYFGR